MITIFTKLMFLLTALALDDVKTTQIINERRRRDTGGIVIKEMTVNSTVSIRYAEVLVHSVVENMLSTSQEVSFQVRIPKEAYITDFQLKTGNKTIKAVIRDKFQALEQYQGAKSESLSAGLVTQQTRVSDDLDSDVFNINVSIAADCTIEFLFLYEELLQRKGGKYVQKIYISSTSSISKLRIRCFYKEKQGFKALKYKTPFLEQRLSTEKQEMVDGYYLKNIDWSTYAIDQSAISGLEKPFIVQYDLEPPTNGGLVYVNDYGDFVHLFSTPCEETKIMFKEIVFVIDVSGSMAGNPIKQVRAAMTSILTQLRLGDYFNIIIFESKPSKWKADYQQATLYNIDIAKQFIVDRVIASGETNINDALLTAVRLFETKLMKDLGKQFGKVVVFLTDGTPTAGTTDKDAIRENLRNANYFEGEKCCKATITTIAFGKSADIPFLRIIANEHEGSCTVIKENDQEFVSSELVKLFQEVENPYYRNLEFSFFVNSVVLPESNITKSKFVQYDCGNELVIGGWTHPNAIIRPSIKADGIYDEVVFNSVPTVYAKDVDAKILSRLVIYEKVRQLLRTAETTTDLENKREANAMALALSLEYGFVTPLTSLVVTDFVPEKKPPLDVVNKNLPVLNGIMRSAGLDPPPLMRLLVTPPSWIGVASLLQAKSQPLTKIVAGNAVTPSMGTSLVVTDFVPEKKPPPEVVNTNLPVLFAASEMMRSVSLVPPPLLSSFVTPLTLQEETQLSIKIAAQNSVITSVGTSLMVTDFVPEEKPELMNKLLVTSNPVASRSEGTTFQQRAENDDGVKILTRIEAFSAEEQKSAAQTLSLLSFVLGLNVFILVLRINKFN